jgi:hypothetical protein
MTPLVSYHTIDLDGCYSYIIAPHICPRPVVFSGCLS